MPDERKHQILIGEDDPDDRLLYAEALKKTEYRVAYHFAVTGKEVMDYLQNTGNPVPCLIFLDLNMPFNGRGVLAALEADPRLRTIPVVVITTANEENEIEAAYAQCANSYVVKPAEFEKLVIVLNDLFKYWFETVKVPGKGYS